MAHNQHNKSRNSGGFALIILGALLLFLAPNINPTDPILGILALVGGIVIGSLGFYLKFIRNKEKKI
jgi:drug/metabolite transporter (DMT)-like permease